MWIWAIIIVAIIVAFYLSNREKFTTRREKAAAISSWLKSDSTPTYKEYASKFPSSDIVDYHSVRSAGAVEVPDVEKVVS